MIELSPVGRGGTPDEVGAVGALLMGPDGTFITGSDFLMDGGVTASYFYGELSSATCAPFRGCPAGQRWVLTDPRWWFVNISEGSRTWVRPSGRIRRTASAYLREHRDGRCDEQV